MTFDRVAGIYDALADRIFGSEWRRVQEAPVAALNGCGRVLIVGGGTGRLLTHLLNCEVVYVELSLKMMTRAMRRQREVETIFLNEDFVKWETAERFDAVLTPFFLDVLNPGEIPAVLQKITGLLRPGGSLHVMDFQPSSLWNNFLVSVMYRFFGILAGVKRSRLPAIHELVTEAGFECASYRPYLKGWIFYRSYSLKASCSRDKEFVVGF